MSEKLKSIEDWVRYHGGDGYFLKEESAEDVADRATTGDLFAARAQAIIALCGQLRDKDRGFWMTALQVVCDKLGSRIDAAYQRRLA